MSDAGKLPFGWDATSISEITGSIGGGTPPTTDPTFWEGGETPWVSPKDMKVFRLRNTIDSVTERALERLTVVPPSSVLVVVRSGILAHSLPVAINDRSVVLNQDMRAFVPQPGVNAAFVAWQLVAYEGEILERCTKDGTTVASIEASRLASFELKLAPAAEQVRVVDAIESLLSALDAATRDLETAKRKLALYRQSLLKSAVEGSLTHEWRQHARTKETGEDLLARLLRERQARWEARQLARFKAQGKSAPKDWRERFDPGTTPDTSNLPTLPDGWVYASIGQCFEVAVGATPSRKAAEYWGGDVPWVSSGEVSFNRIAATRETISDTGLANSSTQINPAGSVLLGMIGEGKTRGQVAILDIPAANNQNCAAIWVLETDVPPEFVYFWLWSRYDETRRGSSGNNQPALNKSLVQAMPVPLAPIEEMREIAERVDVQFAGIEAQEREIDRLLRMAAAQRQNILRAAFSGQLVPQDPNDEPASVLLERIRAQRAASGDKPTARRPRKAKTAA